MHRFAIILALSLLLPVAIAAAEGTQQPTEGLLMVPEGQDYWYAAASADDARRIVGRSTFYIFEHLTEFDWLKWMKYSETGIVRVLERDGDCVRVEGSIDNRLIRGWVAKGSFADDAETMRHFAQARADDERAAQESAAQLIRANAEKKRRAAQLASERARARAAQESKEAEERQRLRQNCKAIYANTIDKKLKDLTVREEQQVRGCQLLGFYPPS